MYLSLVKAVFQFFYTTKALFGSRFVSRFHSFAAPPKSNCKFSPINVSLRKFQIRCGCTRVDVIYVYFLER